MLSDKNTQQTRNKRFPQHDKGIYKKPTPNIINGNRQNAECFSSKIRNYTGMSTLTTSAEHGT